MLTFAKALTRTAIIYDRSYRRSARLWPVLLALLTSFQGLPARAEPVTISPEGVRASAVDIAYDADGTAWLLWVQKGARIPGAGHASADDLYLTRWPADAPPGAPVMVNADTGQVRASALSRARIAIDSAGGVHALYPVADVSPIHGKPVINIRYQSLGAGAEPVQLNTPADNDLSSTSHSNVGSAATFLSLSAGPDNDLYALWIDSRHSEFTESNSWVYGSRSLDNGATWSPDTPLFEQVCPCCQPDTVWSNNQLLVSSRQVDAESHRDPHIHRVAADLGSTEAAVRVGIGRWQLEGCPLKRISVAAGSKQEYVAWYAEMETPKGVWLGRRSLQDESFGNYKPLHPDAAVSDAPATAAHGDALWVVWHAKTADAGRGIYLSASDDGGVSMSTPERLSELDSTAAFPAIALNEREAIIGWETGGQIFAIRRARTQTVAQHEH
jgi:hypothetical protein